MAQRKRIKKSETKKGAAKNPRTRLSGTAQSEIKAVLAVFVGVALFLSYYTSLFGSFGEILRKTGLNLFGYVGYIIPVFFAVAAGHYFIKGSLKPHAFRYIFTAVAVWCASAFMTLMAFKTEAGFSGLEFKDIIVLGQTGRGGGLFGMAVIPLISIADLVGAGVVILCLFVVSLIVATGFAPLHALTEYVAARPKKDKPPKAPRRSSSGDKTGGKDLPDETFLPLSEETGAGDADYPPFDLDAIKINIPAPLSPAAGAEPLRPKPEPERENGEDADAEDIEPPAREHIDYRYPPIELLSAAPLGSSNEGGSPEDLRTQAKKLVETLASFGVEARVLEVSRGPSVTRFEIQPSAGVKVSKIVNLADDIALNLAAFGVRIEAPIPGKAAVGIEIPNKAISAVRLREVIESKEFENAGSKTAFALGKGISGDAIIADIAHMPHLLIAGATGSGKSVCINALIASILYKADPNQVKLIMIDPKVVELGVYNGIPHLMIPVVTDPRRAAGALNWAVQEMMRRYKQFAEANVRDLSGYNEYAALNDEPELEQIIIIIDELSDLMMVAPHEVEDSICRLAQMARAAGMYLVIATQRPSVDVITGVIKANIPSRIAFAVSSQVDSRTILDIGGAEKLLGRGDMLYFPSGASKPRRIQGSYISDKEVERVVEFVKQGCGAIYNEEIMEHIEGGSSKEENSGDCDELLPQAIGIVVEAGQASVSLIQRRLKVGYSRAGRLVDQLEERGIIGPHEGSKPRNVIMSKQEYYEMMTNSD